jgi:predicted GIY-YIG superfamily endonuclease
VYCEKSEDRSSATKREIQIKKLSREKKIELI